MPVACVVGAFLMLGSVGDASASAVFDTVDRSAPLFVTGPTQTDAVKTPEPMFEKLHKPTVARTLRPVAFDAPAPYVPHLVERWDDIVDAVATFEPHPSKPPMFEKLRKPTLARTLRPVAFNPPKLAKSTPPPARELRPVAFAKLARTPAPQPTFVFEKLERSVFEKLQKLE